MMFRPKIYDYFDRPVFLAPAFLESERKDLCDVENADDTTIGSILKRFNAGGGLPPTSLREAVYDDVSDVPSLSSMLMSMGKFRDDFANLPATIRREFDDDPEVFAEVLDNARHDKELFKDLQDLGIFPADKQDAQRSSTGGQSEQTQTESDGRPVGEPAPEYKGPSREGLAEQAIKNRAAQQRQGST